MWPVGCGPGDPAHARTTRLGALVVVEVDATGAEARVGRIAALVERAAAELAPVVQAADRLAGWFTGAVVQLSGDHPEVVAAIAAELGIRAERARPPAASLEAADAHLAAAGAGPDAPVELLATARAVMGRIRPGLDVSLAYNLIGAGLAAAGWISPVLAAVLMPLSSLTVTALAFAPGRARA